MAEFLFLKINIINFFFSIITNDIILLYCLNFCKKIIMLLNLVRSSLAQALLNINLGLKNQALVNLRV